MSIVKEIDTPVVGVEQARYGQRGLIVVSARGSVSDTDDFKRHAIRAEDRHEGEEDHGCVVEAFIEFEPELDLEFVVDVPDALDTNDLLQGDAEGRSGTDCLLLPCCNPHGQVKDYGASGHCHDGSLSCWSDGKVAR